MVQPGHDRLWPGPQRGGPLQGGADSVRGGWGGVRDCDCAGATSEKNHFCFKSLVCGVWWVGWSDSRIWIHPDIIVNTQGLCDFWNEHCPIPAHIPMHIVAIGAERVHRQA